MTVCYRTDSDASKTGIVFPFCKVSDRGGARLAVSVRASGETFPVSCPLGFPRMPADARSFPGQLLAVLRNMLRDNRFVLAAVRVS
jgi:hypothetical protein